MGVQATYGTCTIVWNYGKKSSRHHCKMIGTCSFKMVENSSGQRQVKKFINEYTPKFTETLLNKCKRTVKLIVELLTGHCRL